ncbi:MAG: c-type cytochrome [Pseudomonadota bacterium]
MQIKAVVKSLVLLVVCGNFVPGFLLADGSILAKGSSLYKQACYTCHDSGLVKAPKFGDKSAWNPRIARGIETLTQSVITGKTAMPPRGGTQYTDAQIRQVITFMISKVK